MKINSLPQGSGIPAGSVSGSTGRVSSEARERAKAIAAGQDPSTIAAATESLSDESPASAKPRLKMRTNVSPGRLVEEAAPTPQPDSTETPTGDLNVKEQSPPDNTEQAATEATEPLSPQLAAIAKYRRAVQVKDREIAELKTALEAAKTGQHTVDWKAQLKADPLSVLQDAGVTYDQLTEAILSGQHNPEVAALKAEIAAMKANVDKSLSDRDAQAEQQALNEIQRDIDARVSEGDTYEAIRATRSQSQVRELIHRTWKETGELMDTQEACSLVEAELIEDAIRLAKLRKVTEKLAPTPPPAQPQTKQPQQMKTLTSRDASRPVLDRRARAIAAFYGQNK